MIITWEQNDKPYSNGIIGWLGKVRIFKVSWDGVNGNRNPDGPYILYCTLPGIKDELGNYKTQEDGKAQAEKVLKHWLFITGIKQEEINEK